MRSIISAIAIAALLTAGPARAFDPAGADVIGLRLGMTDAEVALRLAHQGYAVSSTADAMTANTMDGRLRVALSASGHVNEIRYVFFGRGAGALAKIQGAILIRFGDPDQPTPPTWCRTPGHDGICPENQASLTFLPQSLTLRLTAGGGR